MGFVYRRGSVWWIAYGKGGQRRESAETGNKGEAQALLRLREGDVVRGVSTPDTRLRRVTVAEILDSFITHQRMRGAKSVDHVKRYYVDNELIPVWGHWEVRALTTTWVQRYVVAQQKAGYSNSSINKVLACLNRALVLAQRNRTIVERPYIPLLPPAAPREGFYTDEEWARLRAAMSTPSRIHALPVLETARLTGCRISELIGAHGLEWRNLNLGEGWIRLEGGTTKNGEGRTLPILPALHPVLTALWNERLQRGELIPWVFTHRGQPIKSIRTAFEDACMEAGLRGKRLHDFRRTFRRYLAIAGVSDKVGQSMLGHKDARTYNAYFPVVESDKKVAADLLDKVVSK